MFGLLKSWKQKTITHFDKQTPSVVMSYPHLGIIRNRVLTRFNAYSVPYAGIKKRKAVAFILGASEAYIRKTHDIRILTSEQRFQLVCLLYAYTEIIDGTIENDVGWSAFLGLLTEIAEDEEMLPYFRKGFGYVVEPDEVADDLLSAVLDEITA